MLAGSQQPIFWLFVLCSCSYDDPYLRESYKHYTQELLHDQSMSSQLTNKYWTAKSFVKKLKKKEDQSVVAADSDLDAKLEVRETVDNA